jgi:diguanylate cyclase (GGDEF)-like protein/PAS domain S-box-containing protein
MGRAAPGLLGVAAIVVLGVVALRIGDDSLRSAENDRRVAREDLVRATARGQASSQAAAVTADYAESLDYIQGDDAKNQALMTYFNASNPSEAAPLVGLYGPDGTRLAGLPEGVTLDRGLLGPAWQGALEGRRGFSPSFRYGGQVANALVFPIGGPRPWAVFVMVRPAAASADQAYHVQLGSLNGRAGGLVMVDPQGLVLHSWDPSQLGAPAMTPAAVAALPTRDPAVWTTSRDGTEITSIGSRLPSGYGLVFEQSTNDLFGDLRADQHRRDVTLLAVLGGALAALVAFQLMRQRAARRAGDRLEALLENGEDLVLVADRHGALTFVSPSIHALLGHRAATWRNGRLADLVHGDDAARVEGLRTDPTTGPLQNVRLRRADGTFPWFDLEASDLQGHREIGGVLFTAHDVGSRKELEDTLAYRATHDNLTGLANRARFSEHLDGLLGDGGPTRPFALMYLDLDNFKSVNDSLGHDAGDHLLKTVAERLRDAVGEGGLVCRFGGDEFGIVVDDTDVEQAVAVAVRLLDGARQTVAIGTHLCHVDASIGIALAEPGMDLPNAAQLVRQADKAMYDAKQAGRGCYLLFTPDANPPPTDAAAPAAAPSAASAAASASPRPSARVDDGQPAGAVPVPAAERPTARRSPRARVLAVVPIVAAVAIVSGIAGMGQAQTAASREAADHQRLDEALRQVSRGAEFYSNQLDPQHFIDLIVMIPWALDGGDLDQKFVEVATGSANMGGGGVTILSRLDGQPLAAAPASARVPVASDSPTWRTTVGGRTSVAPAVADADQIRTYYFIPILRDKRTVAVLTLGTSDRHGPHQKLLETMGATGADSGWSLVDRTGVVFGSWNPDLLGRRLADPEDLAGLDGPRSAPVAGPADQTVIAAPVPALSVNEPVYLVNSTPTDLFYRDLRTGQSARDASLVIVVLAIVAGLVLVNHRGEQAARRQERRLDALLQHAHDIVLVVADDGRATFVSSAIGQLLGYDAGERLGRDPLELVHPADQAQVAASLYTVRAKGTDVVSDVRMRHADGSYRWFDIDAADLSRHREIAGLLLTCHEITERKAVADQLAFQAGHDPLTQLPNRASFAAGLEALANRPTPAPYAVLFVDLDHFKPVNDTLGHDAGDQVLITIGERLQRSIRVDGEGREADLLCRVGGDEFALVLVNVDESLARLTAERILAAIQEPIAVRDTTVDVGATVGIALSHPRVGHPDAVVRNADLAMYQAKEAGRGRYAVFSPG